MADSKQNYSSARHCQTKVDQKTGVDNELNQLSAVIWLENMELSRHMKKDEVHC